MIPFSDADVRGPALPVVTRALIGVNILVFLYELSVGGLGLLTGGGGTDITLFFLKWGFIPYEFTGGQEFTGVTGLPGADVDTPLPTWATMITSMFIHGGFFHLAGNMMFLWVFGDNIENLLGRVKFLVFYLATGVAAVLGHLMIDPQSQAPLIGASGAVSGVLGAYLVTYPFNRVRALVIFFIITVIELPAVFLLGAWFVWQLIQGLGSLALPGTVSVAFFAHVGGFLAGMVLMAAYRLLLRQPLRADSGRRSFRVRY